MNAPLLEVENLGRQFVARRSALGRPTAMIAAVEAVSFALQAGTTLALVGESGCGKTTLGRLVLRLIDPTAGRIRFDGRDVTALEERQLKSMRRNAQLIFQDPYASLNPRMTVDQILAEPLALHAVVPPSRRGERVSELLRLVGLEPRAARRYPHEFSGGQRQRIAIARALAVEPKLVVCDEPVSRARCVDPRAGAQSLTRAAAPAWSRLYLHFPRSCRGEARRRSHCGDASRSHCRDRAKRSVVCKSAASLYPRAAFRHSTAGARLQTRAHHSSWRDAERFASTGGLRVPSPMPGRDRALSNGAPGT